MGDGCAVMQMYFIPLNWTLKVKMVVCVCCVYFATIKNLGKRLFIIAVTFLWECAFLAFQGPWSLELNIRSRVAWINWDSEISSTHTVAVGEFILSLLFSFHIFSHAFQASTSNKTFPFELITLTWFIWVLASSHFSTVSRILLCIQNDFTKQTNKTGKYY